MWGDEDPLAVLDRQAARQHQANRLFGLLVLAMIALLSAKVINLI